MIRALFFRRAAHVSKRVFTIFRLIICQDSADLVLAYHAFVMLAHAGIQGERPCVCRAPMPSSTQKCSC
ncbi:MAG: hypothetical protein D8M59_06785 [Planctomycetes bacterium]|nr:hypothetical protein [Planctomycetota bacterium]